jgi:hypothetical protein
LSASAWSDSAQAQAFLPPPGQIFQGVTDKPVSAYSAAVGKHPAVYQEFVAWGQWLPGITADASAAQARLMMHITTAFGSREAITPAGIAAGQGDSWLIGLNRALAAFGHPVYVRLMAEMDGYWNPYCGFNANGTSRGPAHSPAAYRQAFRRVALILRGGSLAHIDSLLAGLHMPPLQATDDLPSTQVAMLWVPQTAGAPDIRANQPRAYWPGRAWVDWVGTDFYSKFPNFRSLNAFYSAFRSQPFVFGEWAMWGADNSGFVNQLFAWIRTHPRVRMLVYNQGGPFLLSRYPHAARTLRKLLSSPRFPAYSSDW